MAISVSTAQKIADAWQDSSSIEEVMGKAGLTTKSKRKMRQYRRDAEAMLNIELPSFNMENQTYTDISCPSTLDVSEAALARSYVVTSAVNNSPLAEKFFQALSLFCDEKEAQLLIVPLRYKNPNAIIRDQDYYWDERIHPYVLKNDFLINKSLMVSGLRLSATAVNPLSGLASNSGKRSAIYGHPQIAMEMVATPNNDIPKMIHTTGCVTRPRYSATKAGGKANGNHSFGALYIKVVGNKFYCIQLIWNTQTGTFCFADESWSANGKSAAQVEAIVKGDSHVIQGDEKIVRARGRVCAILNPKVHVFHDIFDGQSISHHNGLFEKISNSMEGKDCLEAELRITADHVDIHGGEENWIIDSNHDRHIERYIHEGRDRKDPKNALIASELLSGSIRNKVSCLEYYFSKRIPGKYKFIDPNKKALIKGIDLSQHGDRGPNGSRGSAKAFANVSSKTIIGHRHSPSIEKGCWQVGTSTRKMNYAKGYSSWLECDCLIYENGKRAMIFYIDGKSILDV